MSEVVGGGVDLTKTVDKMRILARPLNREANGGGGGGLSFPLSFSPCEGKG